MKRITVAVCLDDEGGVMFNNRRQSRDRVLINELMNNIGSRVHIHPYSSKLFQGYEGIVESENPFESVLSGECVFVEQLGIKAHLDKIDRLIIYRWNRLYPADTYFDIDPEKEGFKLTSLTEFAGSSHEKISKGIYAK